MAEIEKHSLTWKTVTEWAEKRRGEATASLIQGGTAPGHDDKLRGEIRAIDDLLALADEPEPIQTPVTY
ncbi:hypothetical protein MHM84_01215 [Halomonas sp. McH1-25]|uniref:hypothetical protein n=1 Tax=unclassified Halomonas TaxID=2609666 RepID=UPI001EF54523|nr:MULTISPECIES: hypothetical protein [unclassified Halomonas]MCG7598401.1 hypothetical protein [Halomonas sp. McH1-25]MCP1342657.1 hypothetical protein [Halomonas sp. FL8]MCP1363812.1 hypothetical protein [Halomonas sp. BBD48]